MARSVNLTVEQIWRISHAIRPVEDAFGGAPAYLVGSVLKGPGWRDVDIRIILPDSAFDRIFDPRATLADQFRMLLQTSISGMLRDMTGLPIDFQVQRHSNMTEDEKLGQRNPCGFARSYVGSEFVPQWRR